jgi:hypothetical protein
LKGRDHLEDLGAEGRIIPTFILNSVKMCGLVLSVQVNVNMALSGSIKSGVFTS